MDFYKEQQARIEKSTAQIGQLAYEKYQLSRQTDAIEDRTKIIDLAIGDLEIVVSTCRQALRDFETYLAVKEGAVTLNQLEEGINKGELKND